MERIIAFVLACHVESMGYFCLFVFSHWLYEFSNKDQVIKEYSSILSQL